MNRAICTAVLLAIVCLNVPAWAGPVLQFPLVGGVIGHAANARIQGLRGSGIKISDLMYGADVLRLLQGHMTFTAGGFLGGNGSDLAWGSGGRLAIKGWADVNGDSKCDKGDVRGTLMTATFVDAQLIDKNGQEILQAEIIDHLNPQLAALLKVPDTGQKMELELMLEPLSNGRWRVLDTVQSGYLKNCPSVPEAPSVILLLGAGLTFVAMMLFRRTRADCN